MRGALSLAGGSGRHEEYQLAMYLLYKKGQLHPGQHYKKYCQHEEGYSPLLLSTWSAWSSSGLPSEKEM